MGLFGRKAAGRADARPALAQTWLRWEEAPQNYERQVRDAYERNPIAQRAVRLVAEGVSGAPLAGDAAVVGLIQARSMGQPLLETLAAHLLLHGNAYAHIGADEQGEVREICALRPERVKAILGKDGWPGGYRYRARQAEQRFSAGPVRPEVVHIRSFSATHDHVGTGCLEAATQAVSVHNAAAKWNKALLDNAARPSGALVFDPGDGSVLSADQFERLRTEMEAGFTGAANAGRPMLLEGGLKWQAISMTPADMDFVGLKAAAARDIALAFGVPPMLLGLPGDSTHANYREANRALWRLTILPLADTILQGLKQGLKGWMEVGELKIDPDQVSALSEDREALWARVAAADFLSREEKRALLSIAEPDAAESGA